MRRRPRTLYTEIQKALMWERWKKGETLHQIARLFDRPHPSIRQILAETGGIRPPQCRRSRLALTLAEREEMLRSFVAGESVRAIAAKLARAPSTVSREIARNGGVSCYRAAQAEQAAWQRAHRPKQCKLAQSPTRRLRHHTQRTTCTGRSLTRCRSANVRPTSKIGRYPGIGRVIWCLVAAAARSLLSWSVRHDR